MNERKLTKSELANREDIIMKMKKNKRALTQKYGKDAEAVMYGRATKLAKKQAESMDQDRIKEMVKTALMNPVKEDQVEEGNAFVLAADAAKDAGKKEFEFPKGSGKMHPVKIKSDINEWGSSDQSILLKSMHRDLGEPTEFPGLTRIMTAAEDATDFYMDDFEEFDTEREGLIMSNARSYALRMFPDFMSMAAKMVEPVNTNEAYVDRFSPKAYAEKVAAGTLDIEDAMEETGYPYTALMTLVKKIKSSASALEEGASTEEKRIAMRAIKSIAKYRGVDTDEAKADLLRAVKELGNLEEDIDLGHEDNEPGMIKAELYRIGSCAMDLYKIMDNLEDTGKEIDLPSWWQSKITTAENNITSAKEYLEFELKEPAIDAMVDTLSENEDSTDEAEKLIIKTLEDEGGAAGLDPLVKAVKKLDMSKDDVVSLLKKMAKVKLHKNGDYILFPVNEGLPKGYWDKKMDAADEDQDGKIDESYATLVNKLKKQGKSEKAAKAIAGAVASYKAKGGGKGPTAKQKG